MTRRGLIWWLIAGVVLAAEIGYLTTTRVFFRSYRIPTESMSPTIRRGDFILVRKTKNAEPGDIIAFHFVADPKITMVARVVARAGDTVEIRDKRLFINGNEVQEPYAFHDDPEVYPDNPTMPEPYRSRDHFGPFRVPPNHYFTLGDNREHAHDGRYWGALPAENVVGRVILVSGSRGWFRPASPPPASSRTPPARPRE